MQNRWLRAQIFHRSITAMTDSAGCYLLFRFSFKFVLRYLRLAWACMVQPCSRRFNCATITYVSCAFIFCYSRLRYTRITHALNFDCASFLCPLLQCQQRSKSKRIFCSLNATRFVVSLQLLLKILGDVLLNPAWEFSSVQVETVAWYLFGEDGQFFLPRRSLTAV